MTIEEAIFDPERPLSVSPREWIHTVAARDEVENDLVERTARRIAAEKKTTPKEPAMPSEKELTGLEKLDLGLDQLVQGVQLAKKGIKDTEMSDLPPVARRAVQKIDDLLDTAIMPYLADILKLSDDIEEEQ